MFCRKIYYVALLIISFLLISLCGTPHALIADSAVSQNSATTNQGTHNSISILASTFVPSTIEINVGDTIDWFNQDANIHTVTSIFHYQDEDDVSHIFIGDVWDSGDIDPGQSFSRIFDQAGTFEYISLPIKIPSPIYQYFAFITQIEVGIVVVR